MRYFWSTYMQTSFELHGWSGAQRVPFVSVRPISNYSTSAAPVRFSAGVCVGADSIHFVHCRPCLPHWAVNSVFVLRHMLMTRGYIMALVCSQLWTKFQLRLSARTDDVVSWMHTNRYGQKIALVLHRSDFTNCCPHRPGYRWTALRHKPTSAVSAFILTMTSPRDRMFGGLRSGALLFWPARCPFIQAENRGWWAFSVACPRLWTIS